MSTPETPPDRWDGLNDAAQQSMSILQQLLKPDLGAAEPDKKPWLAGLLSLFIPGAGQFYNRQLVRALLWFLLLGGGGLFVLVVYLVAQWRWQLHDQWPVVGFGLLTLYALLDIIGAIDAYRTAIDLRDGTAVVAYSLKRQLGLALAGFVPVVGDLAPDVVVSPDHLEPTARERLHAYAQQKAVRWLRRLAIRLLVKALLIGAGLLILAIAVVVLLLALLGSGQ